MYEFDRGYDPGRYISAPQPARIVHNSYIARANQDRQQNFHQRAPLEAAEHYANIGVSQSDQAHPAQEHNQPEITVVVNESGQREYLPSWVIPVLQPDDEGGYYNSRDPQAREVHPSRCNFQRTTSKYYNGGLGDEAWRKKKLKRCGFRLPGPDQAHRHRLMQPQQFSIICFVTIGGKPEVAEPAARFEIPFRTDKYDDAYFATFLKKEYRRIRVQARWYGRLINFKTIAAVEFQTWKLIGTAWSLHEVDSIPETATRTAMSHFSYRLRHPYPGSRYCVKKLEELIKEADSLCADDQRGTCLKWNFRIHIIESIDFRAIYLAVGLAVFTSAAVGAAYGVLNNDFDTGFTVASYVLAGASLVFTAIAASEFLGIETPDSFMANNFYENVEIHKDHFQTI
ncbi:hypothetical protein HD806DRAFT_511822 [Xylariaceae sp. AK1471]|nr:hypothetical protein HD806DRAFT_511822 [Xylariaceae sp. AK1471]